MMFPVSRKPYLLAYDSPDKQRRHRALEAARAYSLNPQLSVHELPLSTGEMNKVWRRVSGLATEPDCILLLRLDPRAELLRLGASARPDSASFGYLG